MGTFLEWMLESSLLVLMVLGIRKIFMGKIHYAAIYSLWIVVLLRLMIPVNLFSTHFSVANLFPKAFTAWEQADASAERERMDQGSNTQGFYPVQSGRGIEQDLAESSLASSANNAQNPGESSSVAPWKTGNRFLVARCHLVFRYGRTFIAVLLLLWFLISNFTLLRALKRTRVLYGQRGAVKIYTVSNLQTPCLYGFVKPAIYLPSALVMQDSDRKVSAEELEQMITHEYVHYCHRDHLWAIFRMVVVSLHWYHPFVWLASSCSKKDAELYCDETVIRLLGEENRFRYGRMLVRLAGDGHWGDFRYSMMRMSKRGREMEQRIRAIGGKRRYSRWMFLPLVAALAVAVGVTCSSGIGNLSGEDAGAKTKAPQQVQSSQNAQLLQQAQSPKQVPQNVSTDEQTMPYAVSYEEAFYRYITVFTNAVNTGSTDQLGQVLLPGSDVYQQQCAIVKNYHKRGIREEVRGYSIPSAIKRTADCIGIDSSEEILVHYGDGSSKVVRQSYRYTCEFIGSGWIITDMAEIF